MRRLGLIIHFVLLLGSMVYGQESPAYRVVIYSSFS